MAHSEKTPLSSNYKKFLSHTEDDPRKLTTSFSTTVSNLKKAIKISDITGYEELSPVTSNRFFDISISESEVFVNNDKSEYGIQSSAHLETNWIKCQSPIERSASYQQVKDFLTICEQDSEVQVFIDSDPRKYFVFVCQNKTLLTAPAFK